MEEAPKKKEEKEKRYLEANDITMNMVAFMAPMGLFWSSLALQIGATDFQGHATWSDMWLGVVLSGILSFVTALSFSVLAVRYPRLGGIYDYCEAAFESSTVPVLRRAARPLQLAAFYGAVLLYWVYPSSVLAPVASNLGYLLTTGFRYAASLGLQMGVAVVTALAAGVVCVAGTRFSSDFNLGIVAIQVVAILLFSVMALAYRFTNPRGLAAEDWSATAAATFAPTSVTSMLSQVTLAIIIYIGFESAVNFAPDTVDVVQFVPKGIYTSLMYPVFLYALSYAGAKLALSNRIASADGALTGADALAVSAAPVGDLSLEIGDAMLGGHGYFFMPIICLGAIVSLFGSYISSVNAGVKVTYQAAVEGSLPAVFRSLHPAYGTLPRSVLMPASLIGIRYPREGHLALHGPLDRPRPPRPQHADLSGRAHERFDLRNVPPLLRGLPRELRGDVRQAGLLPPPQRLGLAGGLRAQPALPRPGHHHAPRQGRLRRRVDVRGAGDLGLRAGGPRPRPPRHPHPPPPRPPGGAVGGDRGGAVEEPLPRPRRRRRPGPQQGPAGRLGGRRRRGRGRRLSRSRRAR